MSDALGAALKFVREEWPLGLNLGTCIVVLLFRHALLDDFSNPVWLIFVFLWLFLTVLAAVLAVVRHADHLAVRLGEPYGTLILTLSRFLASRHKLLARRAKPWTT